MELRRILSSITTIFLFGFVLGCICVNTLWRVQDSLFENDWTFALEKILYYVECLPYLPDLNMMACLLVIWGVIFFLGFWKYGRMLLEGIVLCFGMIVGGVETIWLLNINLKDGIQFLLMTFIRLFIVGLVILGMTSISIRMSKTRKVSNEEIGKKHIKKYLFWSFAILILVLVYIIVHSYVNL